MNLILESRAVAISRSFRKLDDYSPTKKIIKYLIDQRKIDVSKPFADSKKVVMNHFLKEGMKYNIHIPLFSRIDRSIFG